MNSKYPLWLLFTALISLPSFSDELFYGVSEEVKDISISTSSKHDEDLFLTPLSISVVTAEQIKNSAITTIAEAMKLVPGVIVREQTNGQFDVHIRGFYNDIKGDTLSSLNNSKTLLMIDNRVVFDYFNGALFWGSLPIGIEDIDRIEVVRGAVSSLYGSNAVTGVIHIFTKKAKDSASIKSNITIGSDNSTIAHFSADMSFSATNVRLSARSEMRDRYEDSYFSFSDREYLEADNIMTSVSTSLPENTQQSVDNQSIILAINNDPLAFFHYDLTVFKQDSNDQKVDIGTNDIPFTHNLSEASGYNFKLSYADFNARISQNMGRQEIEGFPDFSYDTNISQANIAYQIKLPRWLIQPAIDWSQIKYDGPFLGGERTRLEINYMLRTEYSPQRDWRFITALSYSDYNAPDENEFNYQFLTIYQLDFDAALRASIQTASSSPFMVKQYIDIEFTFPNDPSQRVDVKGDENHRLSHMTTYEVGVRDQVSLNNFFDIEVFHSELDDLVAQVIYPAVTEGNQTVVLRSLENVPQKVVQDGITINWLYENIDWDINVFFTWQETHVYNQTQSLLVGAEIQDEYNQAIPRYFAGMNANWQLSQQLNFNVLSNYLHEHNFKLGQPQGNKVTPSALYTNLSLNYQHDKFLGGYVAIKNLSDQQGSQHFYSDRLEPSYWLGFNIKFGD